MGEDEDEEDVSCQRELNTHARADWQTCHGPLALDGRPNSTPLLHITCVRLRRRHRLVSPPSSCAAEGRPFTICGGIKGRYFKARKQTSKLMLCCGLSQRKCSLDSFPTMPFVSVLARTHPTSSIVRRRWQHQTTTTVKWSSARMASTMAAAADIQCSELDLGRDPTDPSGV